MLRHRREAPVRRIDFNHVGLFQALHEKSCLFGQLGNVVASLREAILKILQRVERLRVGSRVRRHVCWWCEVWIAGICNRETSVSCFTLALHDPSVACNSCLLCCQRLFVHTQRTQRIVLLSRFDDVLIVVTDRALSCRQPSLPLIRHGIDIGSDFGSIRQLGISGRLFNSCSSL